MLYLAFYITAYVNDFGIQMFKKNKCSSLVTTDGDQLIITNFFIQNQQTFDFHIGLLHRQCFIVSSESSYFGGYGL